MIINSDREFAFVHIPKCAGTSVREVLLKFDQREAEYTANFANQTGLEEVFDLPGFGPIKYNHLNLPAMAKILPAELDRLLAYRTITVIRDPYPRFISALSERSKLVSGANITVHSNAEILADTRRVMAALPDVARSGGAYPLELTTFQRQVDYIFLDGTCVLSRVYRIDQLTEFFSDAIERLGLDDDPADLAGVRANETLAHGPPATRLIEAVFDRSIRAIRGVLPEGFRKRYLPRQVRNRVSRKLHPSGQAKLAWLLEESEVRAFIEDHYAEDLALWNASHRFEIGRGFGKSWRSS